ncbi:hypothetical protein BDY19DRAFT_993412 [Irpex rosettiformis]|uniref:Uncharacterized protein n=1 Tax=Irpex rosettiformis TaxID=378272 RepID=A0ACB8U4G2_9APHY|nr:hypothetical protein BDY19DRAFT_993412 [Irpex rosettiformis]
MSFTFKWPRFSDQFHADAIQMLDSALNKGNKPPVIADKIEVVELEMGTQPPELEIRDIGELTMDQFRGIFRLTYEGDAHIVLRTKVQANPLNHKQPDIHMMAGSRGMLAAKHPLVVPMLLRLSHFKLNSYVVLVVSKTKGITLVFKTDPLQNVDINSTFDSIAVIQKFIQREIEGQLRQMFKEDLPGIIHRLSQRWVKTKVEAPYLNKRPPPPVLRPRSFAASDSGVPPYGLGPHLAAAGLCAGAGYSPSLPVPAIRGRSRSNSGASSVSRKPPTSVSIPTSPQPTHDDDPFLEDEHYDPTYGLRPEGLPKKSVFGAFRGLFAPNKGLADLAEERSDMDELDEDDNRSFDAANWENLLSDASFSMPSVSEAGDVDLQEYETVPAVGGGTITRPRVIHAHSSVISSPSQSGPRAPPRAPSRSQSMSRTGSFLTPTDSTSRRLAFPRAYSAIPMSDRPHSWGGLYNPYFAGATPTWDGSTHEYDQQIPSQQQYFHDFPRASSPPPMPSVPQLREPIPRRMGSPSSIRTRQSVSTEATHSIPTPPEPPTDEEIGIRINRPRRASFSSSASLDRFGSPDLDEEDRKIVLKPSLNSVSRLSTLSHSNHTLSPYVRTLEHFTVRTVPPRDSSSGSGNGGERHPTKAKRKRTFYLGGKPNAKPPDNHSTEVSRPESPAVTTSEFDSADMDRYFKSQDDLVPKYSDIHPSYVRRRVHPQP